MNALHGLHVCVVGRTRMTQYKRGHFHLLGGHRMNPSLIKFVHNLQGLHSDEFLLSVSKFNWFLSETSHNHVSSPLDPINCS